MDPTSTSSVADYLEVGSSLASPALDVSGAVVEASELALPLEVIIKILKHTFLPSAPLTPSSPPTHLRGTTHILLVSHAIHDLALPFFYHTITLTKPSHFMAMFGAENGLFVGPLGQARWKLVQQIAIQHDLSPPVIPASPSSWLNKVEFPPTAFPLGDHRFSHMCLLEQPVDKPNPVLSEMTDLVQNDDPSVEAVTRGFGRTTEPSGPSFLGIDPEHYAKIYLFVEVKEQFKAAAKPFIGQPVLLQRCRPIELHLPTEIFTLCPATYDQFFQTGQPQRVDRIVLYCSGRDGWFLWAFELLERIILGLLDIEPNPKEIQLVGLPLSATDALKEWAEKPSSQEEEDVSDWHTVFDRELAWSWTLPDGSLHTMNTHKKTPAT